MMNDDDNLFGEDYNTAFVKALLKLQNNIIHMPDGSEHFDIYLAKNVYPTLVPGLESLAREIDRLTESEGKRFPFIKSIRANRWIHQRAFQSMHFPRGVPHAQ